MEDCNFIASSHGTFTVGIEQKEEFDRLSKESETIVRENINGMCNTIKHKEIKIMKGDMWDDGTPNPLIVKCPICGGIDITAAIGTGQVEYHCNGCNHTWFLQKQEITTDGPLQYVPPSASVPSYSITTNPLFTDGLANSIGQKYSYGWICPKCGKVYAPDTKECLTCNYLANIKVSGQINQSSSAETHMENVTATMDTQEKRVREDGSIVIDKSWFPNLTKDSTVYAGGGGTRWNKTEDAKAES